MKIYKIRDIKTGLFSTGGASVRWSTKGKVWRTLGHVKAHLTLFKSALSYSGTKPGVYSNAVLDEFEVTEALVSVRPLKEI